MAKKKPNALADPDEEKLAQDMIAHHAEADGWSWAMEELVDNRKMCTDDLIDEHMPEMDTEDEEDFDARLLMQRLKPYTVAERERILTRVFAAVND